MTEQPEGSERSGLARPSRRDVLAGAAAGETTP